MTVPIHLVSSGQDQSEGKSRRTYIWGGAIIGAVVTAVGLAIAIGGDPDVIMSPLALLPVVVGGAVIGGIVGALISR